MTYIRVVEYIIHFHATGIASIHVKSKDGWQIVIELSRQFR